MIPGWHTWRRYHSRLIFKNVFFWRHDRRHSEEASAKLNWKENSRVRIGRITFTAEASDLEIGRYSCNPKTICGFLHQEWRITQKKNAIHLYRGLSTKSILYCRSWTRSKKKKSESRTDDVHTRTDGRKTFHHGECTNLSPTMDGLQFVSTTMPAMLKKLRKVKHQIQWRLEQKRKRLISLVRNAKTNFGKQRINHHYVPVSSLEECVVKVVKENREDNCSQDNLRLERDQM